MTNKTFIPAFKANVGDWDYYCCVMKYAEVARQFNFAHELGGNEDLNTMIQRGISSRTQEITDYLLTSEHRFLGAIIVAAWGGQPKYNAVEMADPDELLRGIDQAFGLLTFDGGQQYFALDGQHRLKAIKDAIKANPELGQEQICVIIVPHFHTEAGRTRTRRLFTNINRNARPTTGSENIVLDEDDGWAIATRQLVTDHKFFKVKDRVKVITSRSDDGALKLAGASLSKGDKAVTTLVTLYELVKAMSYGFPPSMRDRGARPSNEEYEQCYPMIVERLDGLFAAAGSLVVDIEAGKSAGELRAPKKSEELGHPFLRPVIQKAVARQLAALVGQGKIPLEKLLDRLRALPWQIGEAPWTSVYNPAARKMMTGKEHAELLGNLLYAHLAPPSKEFIRRTRAEFRQLIKMEYPYKAADLEELLVEHKEVTVIVKDEFDAPNSDVVSDD